MLVEHSNFTLINTSNLVSFVKIIQNISIDPRIVQIIRVILMIFVVLLEIMEKIYEMPPDSNTER